MGKDTLRQRLWSFLTSYEFSLHHFSPLRNSLTLPYKAMYYRKTVIVLLNNYFLWGRGWLDVSRSFWSTTLKRSLLPFLYFLVCAVDSLIVPEPSIASECCPGFPSTNPSFKNFVPRFSCTYLPKLLALE